MIPFYDPMMSPDSASDVYDAVSSNCLGPGKYVERFQDRIQKGTGAKGCLLTTSGTMALSIAAKVLGLKDGDEVLIPAYGVICIANAFESVGLKVRLVDVDPTGSMDPEALVRSLGRYTRAVCFVDFSGNLGNRDEIREICDTYDLWMIEDAAAAVGRTDAEGRAAGTVGHVGTYSFSVPKIVTTGQGGALLFNDDLEHRDRAEDYIDHGRGWRETGLSWSVGTNLRFNDVLAALGVAEWAAMEANLTRKRAVADAFDRLGERYWHAGDPPQHNIYFAEDPAALVRGLIVEGVEARRQYAPFHFNPVYGHLDGDYPMAEWWHEHAVYLPFGPGLTVDDVGRISDAIRGIESASHTIVMEGNVSTGIILG